MLYTAHIPGETMGRTYDSNDTTDPWANILLPGEEPWDGLCWPRGGYNFCANIDVGPWVCVHKPRWELKNPKDMSLYGMTVHQSVLGMLMETGCL